jgi:NADH-quinone oxidoreductase subunit C
MTVGEAHDVFERLKAIFGDDVIKEKTLRDEASVLLQKGNAFEVLKFLHDDPDLAFDYLVDLTAVDYLQMEHNARFAVVYFLYSHKRRDRFRVKVWVHESDPSVRSVIPIWKGAIWLEREVYDMFGITFQGHPDLRRILMPDDYEGHPLRKDYPLQGHGERDRLGKLT